jgi:hypothetical protein
MAEKYHIIKVRGYWWNIKLGGKTVAYLTRGSENSYYLVQPRTFTIIGEGYTTVKNAYNAYKGLFPLKQA